MTRRGNRFPLLAGTFVEEGFDVRYITTDFYHAEKRHFPAEDVRSASDSAEWEQTVVGNPGYRTNISPGRVKSHISFARASGRILKKELKKGDCIIMPSRPPEMIHAALKAARSAGARVIMDVSDIWPDAFPVEGIPKKLFTFYCEAFQKRSVPRVDHFTYTSPVFGRWIDRYAEKASRYFVPLGLDGERWSGSRPLEEIGETIDMLYVGNVSQLIDLDPVLSVIGGREGYSLTILGGGDGMERLRRKVRKEGYTNVRFKGFVPKEEVVRQFSLSHISLVPMIGGTIPNKIFDSIGALRPIIAFGENDASRFVLEEGIGWKVDFTSVSVEDLLSSLRPEEMISMSKKMTDVKPRYLKHELHRTFVDIVKKNRRS